MLKLKELIFFFSAMVLKCFCSDENCGPYFITSYEGTIKYPPVANFYTSPITCSWIIISPPNTVLTIKLKMLDIEKDPSCSTSNCCKHNWLSIPKEGGRGTQQICGSNFKYPGVVALAQKRTVIKLIITKVIHGGKGFELDFAMDSEECPPGLILCAGGRCMIRKHADKFCKRELCPGSNQVPCGGLTECYNNVTQRCDGKKDCPNGADELDCQCAHNMLPCYNGQGCYSFTQKCDSVPDCFDYTDELNCDYCSDGMAVCGLSDTRCFSPSTERCDGKCDCFYGEDELGCESYCQGQIACRNGFKCYTPIQRCNGISDCPDSSDEIGCSGRLAQPICSLLEADRFICANELCISGRKYCDGKNDCGDLSDEVDCFRNSVIAAAIVGSLVCGLLLVIAAGCICRLYRIRTPTNSFSHNGLPPGSGCVGGVGVMHYRDEPPLPASPAAHEFYHREPPPAYSVAVQQQPPPRAPLVPYGGPILHSCAPDFRHSRPMGASETLPPRRIRRHSTRRHRSRRQHPIMPFEPAACCSVVNGVGGPCGGSTPNISLNFEICGFEDENFGIRENIGQNRLSPSGGSTSAPATRLVSPHESTSGLEVDPPLIFSATSQPSVTGDRCESFITVPDSFNNSKPPDSTIERNTTSLIVDAAPPPPPEPARIFQASASTTSSSGSPSRESLTSSTSLVSYLSSNDETPLFANMQ